MMIQKTLSKRHNDDSEDIIVIQTSKGYNDDSKEINIIKGI